MSHIGNVIAIVTIVVGVVISAILALYLFP
jgi:hypothetical protein